MATDGDFKALLAKFLSDSTLGRPVLEEIVRELSDAGLESRPPEPLTVERVQGCRLAASTYVGRDDAIGLLRALADIGLGQFVVGRRGSPTRLEFTDPGRWKMALEVVSEEMRLPKKSTFAGLGPKFAGLGRKRAASAPPEVMGRGAGDPEQREDPRANTRPGPTITVPYVSGAQGTFKVQTFLSQDNEDRGGTVWRLTVENGDCSFAPTVRVIRDGIEIHMAGDAESAAMTVALHAAAAALQAIGLPGRQALSPPS